MNIAEYVKNGFMMVCINKEYQNKAGVISYGDYVAWLSHQPNALVTLYPLYCNQPPRIIKASCINEIKPQMLEGHPYAQFNIEKIKASTEAEA
ncbi:hypothetical protein OR606_14420 [Aeromonas hydrophila]|uniref:hypothetical protein n=1 Tax=Aeromonas hydrophila TaxID=644 RepID=UPI00225BBEA4|nr:hypothetical protein [Aeromonas hydrophila]MCX4041386.1 hypothetical protein [Aeromonas hydrophila]